MSKMAVHYDYSLLEERLSQKSLTQSRLAKEIGMARTSLNLKLNNKREFTQAEILKILRNLSIDEEEVGKYFFNVIVQKTEQKINN